MAAKQNKSQMMNSSVKADNKASKELRRIRSKRGPALDEEMSRRIASVNVPGDARAQHAVAMVLTRALRSVPANFRGALDDLICALEDENETWIYDCLMFILQKSSGQPINPRQEENDDPIPPGKGKIISLIPGEAEDNKEIQDEDPETTALKNRAAEEIDPVTRENLLAVIQWKKAARA